MQIRTARPADAAALEPLFTAWGHPLGSAEVADRIRHWRAAPGAELLVAVLDGEVVGMAAVAAVPHLARAGSTARLVGLVVAERHRRRGVARSLLAAVTEQAVRWGADRIELTSARSRAAAHAFYPALGYADRSGEKALYVRSLGPGAGRPGYPGG